MGYVNSKKYTGVQLYHKKDGDISYSYRYTDLNGKVKRVTVGLKSRGVKEQYVFQKRVEKLNELQLGENPKAVMNRRKKANVITLDMVAEQHYKEKADINKMNNQLKNRYYNHISPYIGSENIELITADDIIKIRQDKNETHAPKTVNGFIDEARVLFRYAAEKGLYNKKKNPAEAKSVSRMKVDNKREKFLTLEEIELLLDTVKDDTQLYLFCLISLYTGSRLGATVQIKKQDINLEHRFINIKDEKGESTYKGYIENDTLYNALEKRISTLNANDVVLKFTETNPYYQIRDRLSSILNKLFNEGLDKNDTKNRAVIHTLRHTFASHLATNGVPIYTIKELMNHGDIEMTIRYAKLAPDSGRDAVTKLNY